MNLYQYYVAGFSWGGLNFDWFYVDTSVVQIVSITALLGTIFIFLTSRNLAEERKIGIDLLFFFIFYAFIAPVWVSGAFYNFIFSKKISWR